MAISFTSKKCIRKSFGRVPEVAPMPNLIEVQKSSYDHFLQMGVVPERRAAVGLQDPGALTFIPSVIVEYPAFWRRLLT